MREIGLGAGGRTRTDMRSEPRQILSLVRIPISPLRRPKDAHDKAVCKEAQLCATRMSVMGQAPGL
jgi:hypothetical protein